MRVKLFHLLGLATLSAATAFSQQYWSTTVPDCSALGETAVVITNSAGATLGYSCYVTGTFVWLAAGGGWNTAIRVAAPSTNPIGVNYSFYDAGGNNLALDTTSTSSATATSNQTMTFSLAANQPFEVDLLGATGNGPRYTSTATGSAYAVFYCPDEITCESVLPQLVYSALPGNPWSITVPIVWDANVWTQWSAVGIDDFLSGGTHRVSMVIYNEGITAATYNVYVYNSLGHLVGSGTTPTIAPFQSLGNGQYGEGGTYGIQLEQVVTQPLPAGPLKILVDGGTADSAVQMFQFTGPSATGLQVAYDSAPSSTTVVANAARRTHVKTARQVPAQHQAFAAAQ